MRQQDSKSAAISELTRQIKEREKELRRYQDGLQLIPYLQEQIQMLQGSIAMIQGKDSIAPKKGQSRLPLSNGAPSSTLATRISEILKQAGKPLRATDIVSLSTAQGTPINYKSMTKLFSGRIRQGKQFYRPEKGKYGLREWGGNQA